VVCRPGLSCRKPPSPGCDPLKFRDPGTGGEPHIGLPPPPTQRSRRRSFQPLRSTAGVRPWAAIGTQRAAPRVDPVRHVALSSGRTLVTRHAQRRVRRRVGDQPALEAQATARRSWRTAPTRSIVIRNRRKCSSWNALLGALVHDFAQCCPRSWYFAHPNKKQARSFEQQPRDASGGATCLKHYLLPKKL
jgi:hypothetical protein